MNTLFKIAGICITLAFLSIPAYALDAAQTTAGTPLTFTAVTPGLPVLSFAPSGNTIMNGSSSATAYTITAGCSKTTTANGMEYAMINTYSGYYQRTQAAETAAPPTTITVADWTAMGGTEAAAAAAE